ncbi:selenocysteine-specific translation elongation factor [Propioniciclava sinopodophylli]|uniref:selenocysteine-specific translation elongation factor n=1 Tax=Propioniciclava sinopodophylli TaxID=1837344 RepID=UPI0024909C19|nr:selenocysteine-specific translation elongation factor [Propioniciclava sinopodophylli]
MRVIATAGHVDHGKSTLVRALTGTDPDRWAEEHRRGLTLDLGYAWTTLPTGEELAFVDVPGHERFIANMLAGLGPAPGVLFVVAADEGWRRQSTEHLAAVQALGIEHVLVAVTRADLADPAAATRQAREHLGDVPVVAVSAVTGAGLDALRTALADLCGRLPAPTTEGRVRLWIDRVFTMRGAGTVATGTLESGRVAVGDTLQVLRPEGFLTATVRGLQALGEPRREVPAVARVAVNLRGTTTDDLARGHTLLTPGAWHRTATVDARLLAPDDVPEHLTLHVGTAAVPARVRPLGGDAVRLTWQHPLPLQAGDRLVLRDPGRHHIVAGAQVLDADPPALTRRGAARERASDLAARDARLDVAAEVARRGWARASDLRALGATPDEVADAGVRRVGEVLVSQTQWAAWTGALGEVVRAAVDADPLQARMPAGAAASALGLPTADLVGPLASDAGLQLVAGHVEVPGRRADLGAAEAGLDALEQRLAQRPFAAPEADDLQAAGLGPRQVAAAVRLGRVLDLGGHVLVLPTAPALAMRRLAALPQPFTTSQARQALDTTRRVVIPLLTELDRRGWTRRIDAGHREVARAGGTP